MKHSATITLFAFLLVCTSSKAEEKMSMETTWDNVPRCVGRIGRNAKMKIVNAPPGTKFITATLSSESWEFGGERVPYPENGIIPEGAIHVMAPCSPGTYRWTIDAEDSRGQVLRTIQTDIPFP
jgi:hypothetical protein